MRKITFFFALMLTMVTSAFAQGTNFDSSKEYYLVNNDGTSPVYFKLNPWDDGQGTGKVSATEKMPFTFEVVATDGYNISAMVDMGMMGGISKQYVGQKDGWKIDTKKNQSDALVFYFETANATNNTFYLKHGNGYLKIENGNVYADGNATNCSAWALEEVAGSTEPETPAAAAPVILTMEPADGATLSKVSKLVITFDKEIESIEDNYLANALKIKSGNTTKRLGKDNGQIDGCTVTFEFAEISASGVWTIEIPAGFFVAKDNGKSEAKTSTFTIDGPTALNKTSVTETAYSFEEIAIEFKDEIAFVAASEVESLNVVSNGEVVATVAVEDMEIDEKTLVLCLETPIAPADNTNYTIEIPANFIAKKSNGMVFAGGTFTYKLKVPFDVKNITPAKEATVDVVKNIVVEFSKNVDSYNTNNLVLVNNADNSTVELKAAIEGKVLTLTPATLVANGTYTLKQKNIANSNGFTALASAKGDAVANVMGDKAEEYLYTITVEHEELEATEYKRNPEIQNNEYDQNKYKLRGVQIFFDEVVKRYNTNGYTGDYGYILDAEGNEVAKLDGCMGGNGTNNKNANPYTTTDITTPGTYKVVVKPGVIFSADGVAEYAGGEFEFTVVKHPVVVAPTAEEGFCYNAEYARVADFQEFEISVKYATEVTIDTDVKVELKKAVEQGFQIVAGETVTEATITLVDGDDIGANEKLIKITFPAEMEYAEGSYIFDVPAGLFTVDGVESEAYATNTFKYKKPVLKITRNFDSWSFIDNMLDMPNSVMITIENAESVVVDATKVATIAVGDDVYTAANCEYYYNEWSNAWYIQMYFEDFSAADFEFVKGEYTLTLPAGLYTVNGVANEEAVKTFTYGDAVVEEFSVTSILPASGNEFESLDAIAITFSNGFKPEQLIVTCGEKRYRFYSMYGMYVAVDLNYEPIVITEPGTYTLDLSELEGLTGDKVFTWTIVSGETTAIDAVNAEAENAVIYDITGRRVSKVTKAGIYVINGVKVLVK